MTTQPSLPARWFGNLIGRPVDVPQFAVRIPEMELRRSGHVAAASADAVHVREEFRAIKKHVLANVASGEGAGRRDPRIVLVTSARPGEGKTFSALNLALSLAIDRDMDVTLIDGDVVGHGLSRKLGLEGGGLLDALDRHGADVVQTSNISNLSIIGSGRSRADAAELLASERMGHLLDSFLSRSSNSMVVLDSAAVLSGSSASVLATHAGQTSFVVACNETPRSVVDEGLTLLDSHIGPLETANVGLILNKIHPGQSAARYSAGAS
ncbi:MAG: P-loop NTPase [Alphaproteobacteria bacterium]